MEYPADDIYRPGPAGPVAPVALLGVCSSKKAPFGIGFVSVTLKRIPITVVYNYDGIFKDEFRL
jgi:hypothetical protein